MLARLLWGLLMVGAGWFMVWKTALFISFSGTIPWAEQHLEYGGTRLFYKLLGTTIILLGFIVMTNLFDVVIGGTIMAIFGS